MAGILPTIIDVSEWQGDIAWGTVKGNIHFAIIRVQDGTYLDKKLTRNISECERLGIPYYCYGFYRNGSATEAMRMITRARQAGATKCLGFILDVEVTGLSKDGIKTGISAIKSEGYRAGLYVANHLYGTYGAAYGQDFVWIPVYGVNDGYAHTQPAHPCDLWQFTSKGTVPGISGGCDCNACVNKQLSYFIENVSVPSVPNPPTSTAPSGNGIVVGATVKLKAQVDYNGTHLNMPGTYRVGEINGDRVVLFTGNVCMAAVKASNLTVVSGGSPTSSSSGGIKVGSTVRFTNPYDENGTHLAVSGNYTVMEVSGNRIVVGRGGVVTAAVPSANLKVV